MQIIDLVTKYARNYRTSFTTKFFAYRHNRMYAVVIACDCREVQRVLTNDIDITDSFVKIIQESIPFQF